MSNYASFSSFSGYGDTPPPDLANRYCVTVVPRDVYVLPSTVQHLQVLSGKAWVTYDMRDVVLEEGSALSMPQLRYGAHVMSVDEEAPLVLEIVSG